MGGKKESKEKNEALNPSRLVCLRGSDKAGVAREQEAEGWAKGQVMYSSKVP